MRLIIGLLALLTIAFFAAAAFADEARPVYVEVAEQSSG
jgi:hypothetical protein